MSEEIKKGDVVRLNSGSPNMTVASVANAWNDTELSVWCEWFDEKFKAQKGTFKLSSVHKVNVAE